MTRYLGCAASGDPFALLVDAQNLPVWPYPDPSEYLALAQVASLFAAACVTVDARPREGCRDGDELVIGIGRAAEASARLYAHLTRRRCATLAELPADRLPSGLSVVVTTWKHLTFELLERLWTAREAGVCPGIICSERPDTLRRQVLVRAAAAILSGPVEYGWLDIVPELPFESITIGKRRIVGSGVSPAELRASLGRGYGLLSVCSHSDGVDVYLGAQIVCPRDRSRAPADGLGVPPCVDTDYCHRLHVPVAEAVQSDALCGADDVAARIAFFYVCFGVLTNGSLVDPRWGYAARLIDSPRIGAFITTWDTFVIVPEQYEAVSRAIADGVPVGQALVDNTDANPATRFCLFGDPRVTMPSVGRTSPLYASGTQLLGGSPAATDNDLLRIVVGAAMAADDEVQAEGMRLTALDTLLTRGTEPSKMWLSFCDDVREAGTSDCFVCGRVVRTVQAHLAEMVSAQRTLHLCSRCGIVRDFPTTEPGLRLDVEKDGTLRLSGFDRLAGWSAGVVVECPDRRRIYHRWANGAQCAVHRLAVETLPAGLSAVAVMVIQRAQLHVFRFPLRRIPTVIS